MSKRENRRVSEKLVRLAKNTLPQVNDYGEEIEEKVEVAWVDTGYFNMFIGLVISVNAATIGIETQERAMEPGKDDGVLWYAIELVFCFIFLGELVSRLYYHRWAYFATIGDAQNLEETFEFVRVNLWNIFDFIVVCIAVLDTFILVPVGFGGNARFVTFLRFVRLIRLIRVIRLFRIFKELWLVASGLLDSLRTLFWVCILLFLFIEVCAIVTTKVVGHNDDLYDPYFRTSGGWDHEVYFKTVLRSMLTLFQIMTLDSWSDDVVRHVGKQQPGMIAFFLAFIAITVLGVLNVIVGVVVEATMRTSQLDQTNYKKTKEKQRAMVFSQLKEIFENADVDGSGTLSLDEVVDAMSKPEVHNKLRMIEFPADRPAEIFNLLDYDGKGELYIEDFITGCIRMKGQAKSKDLLVAQVAVNTLRGHFHVIEEEMAKFQVKIKRLQDTAAALLGHGEHVFLSPTEYKNRHPSVKDIQNIPQMSTKELDDAPWLHSPVQSESLNMVPFSPVHSMDLHQGSSFAQKGPPPLPPPEQAPLPPALADATRAGMIADAPRAGALADAPRAGMIEDVHRTAMLTDKVDEMAIVQVPGAMPPADPRDHLQ